MLLTISQALWRKSALRKKDGPGWHGVCTILNMCTPFLLKLRQFGVLLTFLRCGALVVRQILPSEGITLVKGGATSKFDEVRP